jgi:hypothetical protein
MVGFLVSGGGGERGYRTSLITIRIIIVERTFLLAIKPQGGFLKYVTYTKLDSL